LLGTRLDDILILTLNRPGQANALSQELLAALRAAFEQASAEDTLRAVIVKGAGAHFCAGHDLKEMRERGADADQGKAFYEKLFVQCSAAMQAIIRCPKPVIAQVHGMAVAAGCQLVASCDLAVADSKAAFATPGVNIGLFCSTPAVALARNLSRKHAMEMLLTGEAISARRAFDIGLVNHVTDAHLSGEDALERAALKLARQIAQKPRRIVALGKAAFYEQIGMELQKAYMHTASVMAENMLMREAAEGIAAFLSKRPHSWED
jgi:enoyl-CoA hydratase/carnithine racemase